MPGKRAGKRAGVWFSLVLGGALVVPLSLAHAQLFPLPAGRVAAADRRPLRLFAGDAGRWVWLRQLSKQSSLFFQEGRGPEALVITGADWVEVALDGDAAWVLQRRRGRGALLRVRLQASAQPEAGRHSLAEPGGLLVRDGLADPGGLLVQDGRLYWLERQPGSKSAPAFVPAAGPTLRLMLREPSGAVRSLGEWPAGAGEDLGPGAGDLLGVQDGALWARVRRLSSTELVRFPLGGGEPERVASEAGASQGLLSGGAVYWTAPSPDGAGSGRVSVRRLQGGQPETVTDWLPADGSLLAADGAVYYSADRLYRLPRRLALPEPLREVAVGRVESDGRSLVLTSDLARPELLTLGRKR